MSADHTYRRLNRCGIDNCKASLYYLEDGQWFCKNGHRREGELDLEEDEDLGTQTQTGAKAKKTSEDKEAPVKVLLGKKGYELYLKCIQLILRKQVWVLVHEKGFPAELETIVRDLWALRLQKTLGAQKSSGASIPGLEPELMGQDAIDMDTDYGSGSTDIETVYSSGYWSSDLEVDHAVAEEKDVVKKRLLKRSKRPFRGPGLIVTIALCYLGAVMLRVPVSLGDIYKWVESQELLYTLALQEIPDKMQRLLNSAYINTLRPYKRLNPERLHKTVQELINLYTTQFEITFPELNWPVLTMKYIRDLGLPLEVFNAVKRLVHLQSFSFHFSGTPKLKRRISESPEAKLMALVLLTAKLAWGMDGLTRIPRSRTEPAAVGPDMKSWEKFLAQNKFKGDSIFDYTDVDILSMPGEELDVYMDWYEKTWLAPKNEAASRKKKHLPEHLLSLFPTSRTHNPTDHGLTSTSTSTPTLATCQENIETLNSAIELKPHQARDTPSGTLRPGENYPLWRPDTTLPTHSNLLLEAASAEVCLSREQMVVALRQIEVMFRDNEWLKIRRDKAKRNSSR